MHSGHRGLWVPVDGRHEVLALSGLRVARPVDCRSAQSKNALKPRSSRSQFARSPRFSPPLRCPATVAAAAPDTPFLTCAPVTHADSAVSPGTPTGAFSELHRSTPGDPRGSSQNNLVGESLGGYVYAAATRTYGAAVWNDTRNAADCPAIDAWRQALASGDTRVPRPAPQQDCPPTFGNSDIFGGTYPGSDSLVGRRRGVDRGAPSGRPSSIHIDRILVRAQVDDLLVDDRDPSGAVGCLTPRPVA